MALPPPELVDLVSDRRVIPFVGAGLSATLGIPNWSQLLAALAKGVDGSLPYDELVRLTNDDPLQIAEYLFLKSDSRIGPLRHTIENLMPNNPHPELSSAHVELTNLGAGQIYTTNYDDLIEDTHERLGLEVQRVALPKDVALAQSDSPQVVKYHGDLRHEETLVLTESSYYRRLDFESPMDLKFRSDLLGRSVLFMGYSFRDINIRVIWFKLMEMMKDIPQEDRLPSYMVRVEPNPAVEELNRAVGLRTITLDPERQAETNEARSRLLAAFLHELAERASRKGVIPGTERQLIASRYVVAQLNRDRERRVPVRAGSYISVARGGDQALRRLLVRQIPDGLLSESEGGILSALGRVVAGGGGSRLPWTQAAGLIIRFGPSQLLTYLVARILPFSPAREGLAESDWEDLPWERFWATPLADAEARRVVEVAERELNYHAENEPDHDLAYAFDVVARIANRQLYDPEEGDESGIVQRAISILEGIESIYEEASGYQPDPTGPPQVESLLGAIDAAAEDYEPPDGDEAWDPFEVDFDEDVDLD